MDKSKSERLQPEFSLPYGPRLKQMALIGLALADVDVGSPNKKAILEAAKALGPETLKAAVTAYWVGCASNKSSGG